MWDDRRIEWLSINSAGVTQLKPFQMEVAQMTIYRGHGYQRVEHVSAVIPLG